MVKDVFRYEKCVTEREQHHLSLCSLNEFILKIPEHLNPPLLRLYPIYSSSFLRYIESITELKMALSSSVAFGTDYPSPLLITTDSAIL